MFAPRSGWGRAIHPVGSRCQPALMGYDRVGGPVTVRSEREQTMPKTFGDMVAEGREGTPMLKPEEVQRRMKEEAGTLVVDVRDADGIPEIIPGAVNVSLGT